MTLDQYSLFISIGVLALGLATVTSLIGFLTMPKFRKYLATHDYYTYIKAIGVIAVISTLGALTYQFYYATPVCELCWWQRIFMFPIDVIALVAIAFREKASHISIGILATIGGLFAAYHYYYHFQIFVLDKTLSLPCDGYGTLPACTSSPIVVFGFITIPFMALVIFLVIVWLVILAAYTQRVNNS